MAGVIAFVLLGILSQGVGLPLLWELPAGFRGWVVVRYDDPACPPAERQGPFIALRVPSSGEVCTSSPLPEGWRYVRYEYVLPDGSRDQLSTAGWGRGGKVWPLFADPVARTAAFFVGTEAEFRAAGRPNVPYTPRRPR